MNITYKKDGIIIDNTFIQLRTIINNCNHIKIKEDNLVLLSIWYKGWRGFDQGVYENIVLPADKVEIIKDFILGQEIWFGEIAGKHSEVVITLDTNNITVTKDVDKILDFLEKYNGHEYNHSFLFVFEECAEDGYYEHLTEEDIKRFRSAINYK